MTEKEVEMAYKKMTESDAPDLWDRIEKNLPEKEVLAETEEKKGFFAKIRKIFWGGSTWKTSLAVCALCVIVYGAAQGAGTAGMNGVSLERSADTAKSGTTAYALGGNEGDIEGAGEAEVAADYDGMNYAAADGTTGDDSAASNGTAVLSEKAAANGTEEAADGLDATESTDSESGRKLIRNISLDTETTDFDNLITQLQKETQNLGGYVENSYVDGNRYDTDHMNDRYASLTLRIPKDKTDDFLGKIGEIANVTSRSENVEDVTLTYTDLKSHVEALQAEQEQLMKLMEQAETVEDTMSIQSRLTDVRYELESYMSQLKVYDNQVEYDTVNLTIQEVQVETPTGELSIGQKMLNGQKDSLRTIVEGTKNLCIWLVVSLPYFVILFVVIYAIIRVLKHIRKKK